LTLPVEVQVAASLLGYWFPEANQALLSAIIVIVILGLNMWSVKGYGEAEYWLSILKVILMHLCVK
jgi:lysine-specific permease